MRPTRTHVDIKARNKPIVDALVKDATRPREAAAREMTTAQKLVVP